LDEDEDDAVPAVVRVIMSNGLGYCDGLIGLLSLASPSDAMVENRHPAIQIEARGRRELPEQLVQALL
jgi:hypothetical protein